MSNDDEIARRATEPVIVDPAKLRDPKIARFRVRRLFDFSGYAPMNETADYLCLLCEREILNRRQLRYLARLGYQIEILKIERVIYPTQPPPVPVPLPPEKDPELEPRLVEPVKRGRGRPRKSPPAGS